MKLKGNDLKEKFKEQMQRIETLSRPFAVFLFEEGINESDSTELLNLFAQDNNLQGNIEMYKRLIEEGVNFEFFNLFTKYPDITTVEYAIAAEKKKMPAFELEKLIKDFPPYEIDEKIQNYVVETNSNGENYEVSETEENKDTSDNHDKENSEKQDEFKDEKKEEKNIEVIDEKPEKNLFTQTIEDLLGVPAETLETEEPDSNLECLVTSITAAISADKRKTNMINNLRRVVIIANRHIERLTEHLNKKQENENQIRMQMYQLMQERDEYKKKYEQLNKKINELTSLTALSPLGGIKEIE